jgi:hypothetical protein
VEILLSRCRVAALRDFLPNFSHGSVHSTQLPNHLSVFVQSHLLTNRDPPHIRGMGDGPVRLIMLRATPS